LTYSPTQRKETIQSYEDEIAYYKKLLHSLRSTADRVRVIYVSSQTVILDDQSLYAKAKLQVEALISQSGLPSLILRPGFIFTDDDHLFLPSLARIASLPLTLGVSSPLFSACRAADILQRARDYSQSHLAEGHHCRFEHLGVSLMSFTRILDLQCPKSFRISVPFPVLRVLAIASPKLRKIVRPVSSTAFPSTALVSSYDR
jgi:hypothetical protein